MSDRFPTRWEKFVLWISRGKHEPPHLCKYWMPSATKFPLGTKRACPQCGTLRRVEEYDVDDIYGGSATYCTWGRVI